MNSFSNGDTSSERPIDQAAASSSRSISTKLLWSFVSTKRFLTMVAVGAFVLGSVIGTVLVINRNAQTTSSAAELLPPPPPPPAIIPSAPTGLSGTAVSTSSADLSWSANTDMAILKYIVYRDGTKIKEVSSGTSYSDTGLSADTTYAYAVSAVSTFGFEGAKSGEVSVKTLDNTPPTEDTTPPSTPTNLSGSTVSATEISLSWTASTDNVGVTEYKVYRCSGRRCSPTTEVGTNSTANFSDTGLLPKTTYIYSVTALDAAGNESDFSATASASTSNAGGGGGHGKN